MAAAAPGDCCFFCGVESKSSLARPCGLMQRSLHPSCPRCHDLALPTDVIVCHCVPHYKKGEAWVNIVMDDAYLPLQAVKHRHRRACASARMYAAGVLGQQQQQRRHTGVHLSWMWGGVMMPGGHTHMGKVSTARRRRKQKLDQIAFIRCCFHWVNRFCVAVEAVAKPGPKTRLELHVVTVLHCDNSSDILVLIAA